MYDYKKSKTTVETILTSPTKIVEKEFVPSSDSEFTYENGIKAYVGALFVDIVDSTKLFQSANEDTARVIRCFTSEIISILKDDGNYREIEENENYKTWIRAHVSGYYGSVDYYHCNIIETEFNKWIEENV